MKAKIGVELLRSNKVQAKDKKFEIYDTDLKGFGLIIYPDTTDKSGAKKPGSKMYIVRYRLPSGKQTMYRIGRHTLFTPAQARDKAESILRSVKNGIDPRANKEAQSTPTLQSFFDESFKPWVEAHHKASAATLVHFTQFSHMADKPLDEYTGEMFEQWKTIRLKAGIKPPTINRNLSMIRSLFSKAVEWDCINNHPLVRVKSLKVDRQPVTRFLSDDEKKHLVKALHDREERLREARDSHNRWRAQRGYNLIPDLREHAFADHLKPMVTLSLNTGMRWGELTALTWGDVDLQRSMLTVRGHIAKSGTSRHIPLNSAALSTLEQWKKQQPATEQTAKHIAFPGKDGKKLDNLDKSWSGILKAAKITDFRWHDMRHTFASNLVMAGVDLNTVRELLGHSDIKMTLRYSHLAPEHKALAVSKLI